jgi:hypothetical protein
LQVLADDRRERNRQTLMITIEIAEIPIAIDNYYDVIELRLEEYRTSRRALFTVSVSVQIIITQGGSNEQRQRRNRRTLK